VRLRQRRQGERESRRHLPIVAVRAADQEAPGGVELDAGAQQQHVPLERSQAEHRAQAIERAGGIDGRPGVLAIAAPDRGVQLGRRPLVAAVANAALEQTANARQLSQQMLPDPFVPRGAGHGITTEGASHAPEASAVNGLSAPSTETRTR
jgi:hypothetical protein